MYYHVIAGNVEGLPSIAYNYGVLITFINPIFDFGSFQIYIPHNPIGDASENAYCEFYIRTFADNNRNSQTNQTWRVFRPTTVTNAAD